MGGGGQLLCKARSTLSPSAPAPVTRCRLPLFFCLGVEGGIMNSNLKCVYFDSSFFSSGELDRAGNNAAFFFPPFFLFSDNQICIPPILLALEIRAPVGLQSFLWLVHDWPLVAFVEKVT